MSEHYKDQLVFHELLDRTPEDMLERARGGWKHKTRADTHLKFKGAEALGACLDLLQRSSRPEKEIWYEEDRQAKGLRRPTTLERPLETTFVIKTNIEVAPGAFVAIAARGVSMTRANQYACFVRPQEMDSWPEGRELQVEWRQDLFGVVEQVYEHAIRLGFVPLNPPQEVSPSRPSDGSGPEVVETAKLHS
ncbi:MAG: hypothetical protein SFW62_03760 [Alphaproteobacteria bacterium]|nr:hypothetical protein [Alphaproteobacteria bacterium]